MADDRDAQERRSETRWPAFAGLVVALVLYILVPNPDTAVLRQVATVILILMFLPLLVENPHRLTRQSEWSRWLSITFTVALVVANQVNVAFVIRSLIEGSANGAQILLTALQVWITNVIAFGLLYWDIDRGGPVARGNLTRSELRTADFKFPQDESGDDVDEISRISSSRSDWRPGFVDYLYVSLTNMMAFSPTDAMPMRSRTKLIMGVQGVTGFVLLALVISRAVNILGG
ncbi:putative membrane protein [Microterricola gilva]|uniref:Putative membrane protein n=1 Tax=Microterricola gilva TaxID=393267 RepID=A0A4V2GAR4_9MICO|nr:putative membrane protein [Microterricola gilva]